jgi:hypothetical protein
MQKAEGSTSSKPRDYTYTELCKQRRTLGREIGLLKRKITIAKKEMKVSIALSVEILHEADDCL